MLFFKPALNGFININAGSIPERLQLLTLKLKIMDFINLRLTEEDKIALKKKHYSKNYKGYLKQYKRQSNKGTVSEIEIKPIILTYDSDEGAYIPLVRRVRNTWVRDTNLDWLCSQNDNQTKEFFYYNPKITLNSEGKAILGKRGKKILEKRKTN